jgi:hypothetical protein
VAQGVFFLASVSAFFILQEAGASLEHSTFLPPSFLQQQEHESLQLEQQPAPRKAASIVEIMSFFIITFP